MFFKIQVGLIPWIHVVWPGLEYLYQEEWFYLAWPILKNSSNKFCLNVLVLTSIFGHIHTALYSIYLSDLFRHKLRTQYRYVSV